MVEIPDELRTYLEAVVESNDRLVETKRRQLDPNLRDDDSPWLDREQENMALMVRGFEKHFGGEAEALKVLEQIGPEDPKGWKTWDDVFATAEKLNARIRKLLG